MVIFQYNLYIFGIHLRTVLYPKHCYNELCYKEVEVYKQEAHGPWLAHLSETATADIQMLCNIFPILSLPLTKGSSLEQFLVLRVFFIIIVLPYIGIAVNGAWPFKQTLNPISTVGWACNLVEIGQVVSEELFSNIMILYMYTAQP